MVDCSIISEISVVFLSEESFDEHINKALRVLGIFLDVSRSYLFLDSRDGKKTYNTNEWNALGIKSGIPFSKELNYDDYPSFKKQMSENTIFYCENVNSLEENFKKLLLQQDIKSMLVVPIFNNKKRIGFLGVDECTRFRHWSSQELEALKLVSELVGKEYYKIKLQNKVKFLKTNDKLTKLYSRSYFFEQSNSLEKEFFKDHKHFSLIIVDIDYFKEINSEFGHAAGDFIIKEFGEALRSMIREHDFIARYDGTEFIVVTKTSEEDGISALLKRIKTKISKKNFLFENKEIKISFSYGIANSKDFNKDKFSLSAMVSLADEHLQTNKNKRKLDKNKI